MRVLIACEYSGRVRDAFIEAGVDAVSCDLLDTEVEGPHIKGDALEVIDGGGWDAIIAFPPCTHLASSGARWFAQKRADGRQQQGIDFFMRIAQADAPFIAIENPVGIMSTEWKKPTQIIQPFMFGDEAQKTTCLWLKGLPNLEPTNVVGKGDFYVSPSGKRLPAWYSNASAHKRSLTFPGIAKAMGDQWGAFLTQVGSSDLRP